MQTLEIVPLDGERKRSSRSFTLVGENEKIVSYTEVGLSDGQIKGFTLVWPAGDEARRTRVLAEMRDSFARTDGVLDPSWSDSDDQAIDLVSGLQIRRPRLSRSGFFVDAKGTVVTTMEAIESCGRLTLDEDIEASLLLSDAKLGIAVLTPNTPLAPAAVAKFTSQAPRLKSEVAVAGYSYGGVLGAPTMTFGQLADLRGLRGEAELTRLDLTVFESDAGGPVFDQAGGVLGMLLPRAKNGPALPAEVNFAADGDVIQAILEQSGINAANATTQTTMPPEDITRQARAMTVLVGCWD